MEATLPYMQQLLNSGEDLSQDTPLPNEALLFKILQLAITGDEPFEQEIPPPLYPDPFWMVNPSSIESAPSP